MGKDGSEFGGSVVCGSVISRKISDARKERLKSRDAAGCRAIGGKMRGKFRCLMKRRIPRKQWREQWLNPRKKKLIRISKRFHYGAF